MIKSMSVGQYQRILAEEGDSEEFLVYLDGGDPITPYDYVAVEHGHSDEVLGRFRVGMSDGQLCQWLGEQGFEDDELIEAGLMNAKTRRDFWPRGAILYPHYHWDEESGQEVVSHFSQKDITGEKRFQAKSEHRHPGCVFFNQIAVENLENVEEVILVEGENDVLSVVGKAGYDLVLGCGGALQVKQIKYLQGLKKKKGLTRIRLLFDNDEAGRKHTAKAFKKLEGGFDVRDVSPALGDCKDIDEFLCRSEIPAGEFIGIMSYRPPALDYKRVLKLCGVEVLGEGEDQSIILWLTKNKKRWVLKDPSRWQTEQMCQALGQKVFHKHLWLQRGIPEERDKFTPAQIRTAVAFAAHDLPRMDANSLIGQGVWRQKDRFLVVNGATAFLYDGAKCIKVSKPRVGNRIIDFNAARPWTKGLPKATKQMTCERAKQSFAQLEELLRLWNWTYDWDAKVVASLVISTFIQACWRWRPLVSIIGSSDCGKSTLLSEVLAPVFGEWA